MIVVVVVVINLLSFAAHLSALVYLSVQWHFLFWPSPCRAKKVRVAPIVLRSHPIQTQGSTLTFDQCYCCCPLGSLSALRSAHETLFSG